MLFLEMLYKMIPVVHELTTLPLGSRDQLRVASTLRPFPRLLRNKKGPRPFLAGFFLLLPRTHFQYLLGNYLRLPNRACDYVFSCTPLPPLNKEIILDRLRIPRKHTGTLEKFLEVRVNMMRLKKRNCKKLLEGTGKLHFSNPPGGVCTWESRWRG